MKMKRRLQSLAGAAALTVLAFSARGQEIKLGFNGDLSAWLIMHMYSKRAS
jgi:hypothetical protein